MKIVTLVKYSMDVAEIKVDLATHALRMSGVPQRFGDLDRGVVEAAVRLKEASEAEVEVLCFGPPAALGAVKDLLAMGADRATVIEDPFEGSADASVVLGVLEAALIDSANRSTSSSVASRAMTAIPIRSVRDLPSASGCHLFPTPARSPSRTRYLLPSDRSRKVFKP